MAAGPSKALEALIGFVIPPACRDEVLGDLYERYSSPGQYIFLALRTVPFVLMSRIRRTTDAQVLFMEAMLLYASFLGGEWYADRSLLTTQWGLLRPAIPAILILVFFVFNNAWGFETKWLTTTIVAIVVGISSYFNGYAAFVGLMLVCAVELLFRPERRRPGKK